MAAVSGSDPKYINKMPTNFLLYWLGVLKTGSVNPFCCCFPFKLDLSVCGDFKCPSCSPQVVDYYKEACRALENSETASLLGKIQKDWKKLVQMKIYYFAAVAHVSGKTGTGLQCETSPWFACQKDLPHWKEP